VDFGTSTNELLFPAQTDVGVCHYVAYDISELFSREGEYLGSLSQSGSNIWSRPYERMLISRGTCPRQDDDGYINANGISPGIFRMLISALARLASSPKEFDAAFAKLQKDEGTTKSYRDFRAYMQGRFGNSPAVIDVTFRPFQPGLLNTSLYEVRVARGLFGGWVLGFEFTDGGPKIIRMDAWVS
jgi:hypothetical protein